jgi:hypothetical protein
MAKTPSRECDDGLSTVHRSPIAALMGHAPQTNNDVYKRRRNLAKHLARMKNCHPFLPSLGISPPPLSHFIGAILMIFKPR